MPLTRALLLALPGMLVCRPVLAHVLIGVDGFPGGALHPLLVPAQTLTLIALGLLAGTQGPAAGRRLFAVFALSLAAAVAMVVAAYAPRETATILLLCALAAGLSAALGRPLPFALPALVTGVGSIALLLDSVPPLISATDTLIALAGTMMSACIVYVLAAWLAMPRGREWRRIAVRIAGSWCAASALLVLAQSLAR